MRKETVVWLDSKAAIPAFHAVARAIVGDEITAEDKTNLSLLYKALADAIWPKEAKDVKDNNHS